MSQILCFKKIELQFLYFFAWIWLNAIEQICFPAFVGYKEMKQKYAIDSDFYKLNLIWKQIVNGLNYFVKFGWSWIKLSCVFISDNTVSSREILGIASQLMRDRYGIYECTIQTEDYMDEMNDCIHCRDPAD